MLYRFIASIIGFSIIVSSTLPGVSHAQFSSECRTDYSELILKEHRIYRNQLFGIKPAEQSHTGAILYDKKGQPWLKRAADTWLSINESQSDDYFEDNIEIDTHHLTLTNEDSELEQRYPRGVLGQTGVLTSDLIPELVHNLAAFDCRMQSICGHVRASTTTKKGGSTISSGSGSTGDTGDDNILTTTTYGCLPYSGEALEACSATSITEPGAIIAGCQEYIAPIVERERQLLLFITEYDAAYRTLLQLEGMNSLFLRALQWHVEQTLSPFTRLIGFIETIPCFVSSCDASGLNP